MSGKSMVRRMRKIAERILPRSRLVQAWTGWCLWKSRKARRVFASAGNEPAFLGWEELDRLQKTCPPFPYDYHYDDASTRKRGEERAGELRYLLGQDWSSLHDFLELGTWDGMTCAALKRLGKRTVGIDISARGLAKQARENGAVFLQMRGEEAGLKDDAFDCVFSFNSFEHFSDPEGVLREALRVVRPGGYLYFRFGPLYWSPKGMHQFKTVNVPYHQCLFPMDLFQAYAEREGIPLGNRFPPNGWTVDQYRKLWRHYSNRMARLFCHEILDAGHVDMILRYPSCFKSKCRNFDNFLVAHMEALFRKREGVS